MANMFGGNETDDRIQEVLPGALEVLEAFDYEERFSEVQSIDEARMEIRDMFIEASQGENMPWEELAALAILALARGL